jgi:hypothetical protein
MAIYYLPKLKTTLCPLYKLIAGKYTQLGPVFISVKAHPKDLLLRQNYITFLSKSIRVPIISPTDQASP